MVVSDERTPRHGAGAFAFPGCESAPAVEPRELVESSQCGVYVIVTGSSVVGAGTFSDCVATVGAHATKPLVRVSQLNAAGPTPKMPTVVVCAEGTVKPPANGAV
jgi:hypothetical protein